MEEKDSDSTQPLFRWTGSNAGHNAWSWRREVEGAL